MSSILVLDDRPADRELLATLLGHAGHSVREAATGAEALRFARAECPDLVITDILMPEMNGYEFVRLLRRDPDTGTIPVIFYTANYSEREVRRLASAAGVSRFISKPSEAEDIISTVEDVLSEGMVPHPLADDEFDREQLRLLNDKLVEKVGELEKADVERRKLMSQLINAHEEERRRIAGEIHDDSIQSVVAIGMRFETLARRIADPEVASELTRLQGEVGVTVERLRHLLFELQPVALDRSGLRVALEVVLEQAHAEQGLEYEVVDRTTRQPNEAVRTLLYRAGREALTNVRKHAGASRVEVVLDEHHRGFSVRVRDDGGGVGVAQALRVRPGHLGLAAMRERVETAGGRLVLESEAGVGTALDVWLPDLEAGDA